MDVAKFINMIKAKLRQTRDLIRKTDVFIKNKAKIASRLSGVE